ncbi:MAG: MBL fold metallo-hydrolase [Bdellovibrionales bacterium]|nr:MBL fold metallo-hydrolase [Bdellovibrionales bacterium]
MVDFKSDFKSRIWICVLLALLHIPMGCLSAFAETSDRCVIPWKVQRKVRDQCWAAISIEDDRGSLHLCIPRKVWNRWLAQSVPRCLPEPRPDRGVWAESRPNLFERSAPPNGKPIFRRFQLSEESHPQDWMIPSEKWKVIVLSVLQWIEFRRERFSQKLSSRDPSGWLRFWLLNESPGGTDTSRFFLLGYVHLLTTAGVHLLYLSLVVRALLKKGLGLFVSSDHFGGWMPGIQWMFTWMQWFLFIWVWALSGWRWGLLRPIALLGIQQWSRSRQIQWRRGWPLVIAVSIEAFLARFFDQDVLLGRAHYFLAGWGGVWGAHEKHGWRAHWGMAWGSWLWVAPLQLWHEGWVSVLTPILSLVTIPIVGGVIFPLGLIREFFIGSTGLGMALEYASSGLLNWTMPLAVTPGFCWNSSFYFFLGGVGLVALLRLPFFISRRHLYLVFTILLVSALVVRATGLVPENFYDSKERARSSMPQATELIQLDVGQGDAALVFWKEHHRSRSAAIDFGSSFRSKPSDWIRTLSKRGITQLDAVVLTHADEDHLGGLSKILPWIRVKCAVIPKALRSDPRLYPVLSEFQKYGVQVVERAAPCFPFPYEIETASRRGPNTVMAAVLVPVRSGTWYFNLGDSGFRRGASETGLLKKFQKNWPEAWSLAFHSSSTRIWKATHHGSGTSNSSETLREVRPQLAWVSVGWQNRYHHPHPSTLDRLSKDVGRVCRTDLNGVCFIQ